MYDTDISMNAWPDSTQWVSFLVKIFCSLLRSRSRQYYKYRYMEICCQFRFHWHRYGLVKVGKEMMVVEGGKKSWVFFGF